MMSRCPKYILFCAAMLLFSACAESGVAPCDNENPCGGCTTMNSAPGDKCGYCGTFVCYSEEEIRCIDPGQNACGGCTQLSHMPGEACDGGLWVCEANGTISCKENVQINACGGTAVLPYAPKTSCGVCGVYECDGVDNIVCNDPGKNECGGCSVLKNAPGDACGSGCGFYVCDSSESLTCNDLGQNACDGCSQLEHEVGSPCGACGFYECQSTDAVTCNDPGQNACGGCEPLMATVGDRCGDGDCAFWTCDGLNNVVCGNDGANACGGCGKLDHAPGDACKGEYACCTYVCENGELAKYDRAPNECGGCEVLDHAPGSKCSNNAKWSCDYNDPTHNTVVCECTEKNECGGCNLDAAPVGTSCSYCGSQRGKILCQDNEPTCLDNNETIDTAKSDGIAHKDGDDNIYKFTGVLINDLDIDYYTTHVDDEFFAILTPEIWIANAPAYMRLCVYILEDQLANKSPYTPYTGYTNSGSGKDSNGNKMTVTASESVFVKLKNGKSVPGFCSLKVDAGTRYMKIGSLANSSSTNSLTMYVSVDSIASHYNTCSSYTVNFKF